MTVAKNTGRTMSYVRVLGRMNININKTLLLSGNAHMEKLDAVEASRVTNSCGIARPSG